MNSVKFALTRFIKWSKKNKNEFIVLLLILSLGAFVRLYRISEYMTFLGDEGRDAIIVRRLLVNFDPILIGPGTSIGNIYLGPLYYYLSAPFLFLANFSPVGPSVMVALFGIATIFLIWYTARAWFGKSTSVVSSLLYALSPVIIIYSRSSWNPNIMPFFAMLSILSLWKIWKESKYVWFIVLGISYAFVLQSHYLGLLLIPTIIVVLFIKYIQIKSLKVLGSTKINKDYTFERKSLVKNLIIGVLIFLFLMSPLLIFDIRHNWINFKAMKVFFTQRESTVSIKPWKSLPNLLPTIRDDVAVRIISGTNLYAGKYSTYVFISFFAVFVTFIVFKFKKLILDPDNKDNFYKGILLLIFWMGLGLVGLGLYKQHLYDHYFGFMFPAIFLFIGAIYQKIHDYNSEGLKILITAWVIILIGSYIINSPLRGSPNFQMYRAKDVAKFIKNDIGGEKFNLAVIAEQNYEDGYQYFLEKDGANVIDIDAQKLEETIGQYLYVVCEIPDEKCDPTHSSKAQVANFGWSKVENKWSISGVVIYKLAHTN